MNYPRRLLAGCTLLTAAALLTPIIGAFRAEENLANAQPAPSVDPAPDVVAAPIASTTPGVIAVVLANRDDVRKSTIVGPSGQVYVPDGAGSWVRTVTGGVAADVTGATRLGSELVVAGRAAPMYRFDGKLWHAASVGQRGRTVMGTGSVSSVAIGKEVFVEQKGKWVRVGTSPAAIVALWAHSKTDVVIATAVELLRLRGTTFRKLTPPTVATALAGSAPYALVDGGLIDTTATKGKVAIAVTDVVAMTERPGSKRDLWLLQQAPVGVGSGVANLIPVVGGKLGAPITAPTASTPYLAIAADSAGNVLLAAVNGNLQIWDGKGWTAGAVASALPVAPPGPGPARSR